VKLHLVKDSQPKALLIVEDEEVEKTFREILSISGYEVLVIDKITQAREILDYENGVKVVVALHETNSEGRQWAEFVKWLRETQKDTRYIPVNVMPAERYSLIGSKLIYPNLPDLTETVLAEFYRPPRTEVIEQASRKIEKRAKLHTEV